VTTPKTPTIAGIALGDVPRIVAAGGEAEVEALAAADGADLVELRADLFDDPTPAAVVAALERLRSAGRPVILTVRAATEGGGAMEESRRREIYVAGLPHAHAIDVEIASTALVEALVPQARAARRTVILSAHALDTTPTVAALLGLVDRAETLGADLVKLAAHARDLEDVRTLLAVTLAARHRGIVTVAMGPTGTLSRLLFPAAGSLLTYASVGRPTAPGQMPLGELAALLRRLYP
jgi:3-dehydroquinate dehydratase I